MTPTREQLARAIDAIMADLRGRSGVLDGVDRDVQDEMRSELVGVLAAALAPQEAAPMPPIEVGDWASTWEPPTRPFVVQHVSAGGARIYGRGDVWVRPMDITEIRKANGTVWRREPRR